MIIISALLFLIVGLIGSLLAFGLIVQIAAAVITGLVAGSLARAIVPGEQPMSWFCTVALGIAGALVSNVAIAFFGIEVGWFGSTIGALVGAVAVLLVIGQARAAGMIVLLISATQLCSGCGYRLGLGLGPQRVASADYSGPVAIDLKRPITDLPTL